MRFCCSIIRCSESAIRCVTSVSLSAMLVISTSEDQLSDQRMQDFLITEEWNSRRQCIEAPDVSSPLVDEIAKDAGIDDVVVDDEVIGILDVWKIHVCHPVDEQQQDAEAGADAHHEADKEGQSNQQMTITHEKDK